jgi:hypothetical protein
MGLSPSPKRFLDRLLIACLGGMCCILAGMPLTASAQPLVPGTGQRATRSSDDFEDPKWTYNYRLPKGSYENDNDKRLPSGASANGRWFEGALRGQPDVVQRVATPEGGLPGSTGALLMQSRDTGVPGSYSYKFQQDDLIANVVNLERGPISVSRMPSVVVRVFLPPWDQWERRTGPSFGFRASCETHKMGKTGRWGRGGGLQPETYWPGMFIQFNQGDGQKVKDSATLLLRGASNGGDFAGVKITKPAWWTLGLSFTPDGQVHYFAHEGVADLISKDHLSSQYPYGYNCEQVDTYFFDVISGDNGNQSTAWIIDDPALYYLR